jgi:hypothetical protein
MGCSSRNGSFLNSAGLFFSGGRPHPSRLEGGAGATPSLSAVPGEADCRWGLGVATVLWSTFLFLD